MFQNLIEKVKELISIKSIKVYLCLCDPCVDIQSINSHRFASAHMTNNSPYGALRSLFTMGSEATWKSIYDVG